MTVKPILLIPDPRLKKECAPVEEVTDELRALIDDMIDTMYDAPGVGLAAPQIGVLKRVLVMDCTGKDEEPAPVALINPVITYQSKETSVHEEGCLSIPDSYADVTRPEEVTVKYTDRNGDEQNSTYNGLWATCVQHEIDHLDGKLFIDYLGPVKRQMIVNKTKKIKKERARERE